MGRNPVSTWVPQPDLFRSVITRVPGWLAAFDCDSLRATFLPGLTNRNYLVRLRGERFVLRVAGVNTDRLGVDRYSEQLALQSVATIGVGPEVVQVVEPEGHLVTRFIDGRKWSSQDAREPENLRRLAATLRQIHLMRPIGMREHSPLRASRQHLEIARSLGVDVPDELPGLLDHAGSLLATSPPGRACLCHNDVCRGNVIDAGEPALRLVDWEYAGLGDAYFDLAAAVTGFELSEMDAELLVTEYQGQSASDADLRKLRIAQLVHSLRERTWFLVQQANDEEYFGFIRACAPHFDAAAHLKRGFVDSLERAIRLAGSDQLR